MIVAAIIFDILSCIPYVNIIIDPIAALTLGIMGMATGTNIYSDEDLPYTLGIIGVKFIPILSAAPLYTLRVVLTQKKSRQKEAALAKKQNVPNEIQTV
jgi:hypothetical protein